MFANAGQPRKTIAVVRAKDKVKPLHVRSSGLVGGQADEWGLS